MPFRRPINESFRLFANYFEEMNSYTFSLEAGKEVH